MSFFTMENLKQLGLNEEQIEKIFTARGKELAKYKDYEEIKQKFKEQGEELEKIKDANPEELKNKIENMAQQHKEEMLKIQETHQKNLKQMAIKMNLRDAHDSDIIMNLLELGKIDLDENGNVKMGLEEQVKELKKNKPFLFKEENEKKIQATTTVEGNISTDNKKNYNELLNDNRKNGGSLLESIKIINEAAEKGEILR